MNGSRNVTAIKERAADNLQRSRTTIGLRLTTKSRLDNNRAPGQCYDGFLTQMVDLWERTNCR
jgi:transcriptional regulator